MNNNNVRTLERAIGILRCFDRDSIELNLSEIAQKTGLSVATSLRLIRALEKHDFLVRHKNKCYSLGFSIHLLGSIAKFNFRPQQIISSYMLQIRDKTLESVSLYGPGKEGRICYEHVESQYVLSSQTHVGKSYPLWAGAGGRVLLAYMQEDVVFNEIAKVYAKTKNTITNIDLLRKSLNEIKEKGYAISLAEQDEGICAVAIPIFNGLGSIKYSLSVSGPAVRFTRKDAQFIVPYLKDIGQRVSMLI